MGTQETMAGGMFVRDSQARVPLTGVKIDIRGSGAAARVTVCQQYINLEHSPIEAVYSFPLEEGSAVCELIVECGGRRLLGKIEEREKAFEQYDEAMAAGNGAFLADQDRPNIFTLSVGNLLPGQQATVSLSYVTELEQHGQDVRIMLPTTISPRYVPPAMRQSADPAELERINPPTVAGPVPYGLSLALAYTTPQGVKSVACPSHPAQVVIDGNRVQVELMGSDIQLDRDFVVNIRLARPFEPCALLTRDGDTSRVLMINLYPELKRNTHRASEYIFMVDRSGSMHGDSISQALNALRLALRSMEQGDTFNIIGFGSRHEKLFAQSQPYNQRALDEASKTLESWGADLGGTELLAPLQEALQASPGALPRQIMLLTDGQVGNESDCIATATASAASTRIFTFGIGYGASEFLLKGLARACRGKAEFIHPNERIEPIVMRQFARAAAPYLENVRLDWGGLTTDLVSPARIPSLFDGDRLTLYARLENAPDTGSREIAVLADGPEGTLRFPVTVDFAAPEDFATVPVLMARSAIRELEEGRGEELERGSNQRGRKQNRVSEKVRELALAYRILSSETSFVAVEERMEGTQTERAQLRRVPVALTRSWGREDACLPGPAPMLSTPPRDMNLLFRRAAFSASICEASVDPGDYPGTPPRSARQETRAADPFMLLSMSQKADGSFWLEPRTLRKFGLDHATLAIAVKVLGSGSMADAAVHTAITLALLERRFARRRDEWEMLADKAERWLARQALKVPNGAVSWAGWAGRFL